MSEPSVAPGPTIKEGLYSHRFQGNALDQNETTYYLAGLGTMTITKNPVGGYSIAGLQDSVDLPLRFSGGSLVTTRSFKLVGSIDWDGAKNLWVAGITFTGTEIPVTDEMKGTFVFTRTALADQYWVMATGLTITLGDNLLPAEAVSGEVHRIGNLP